MHGKMHRFCHIARVQRTKKKSFYCKERTLPSKYHHAFNSQMCRPQTRVLCLPYLAPGLLLYTFLYLRFVINLVWQLKSNIMIWNYKQMLNAFWNSNRLPPLQILPLKPIFLQKCKILEEFVFVNLYDVVLQL